MRDKILEFLKKNNEYTSGDHLAHSLGISRQGLWKHIQELRDSGYDIAAVPHLGYKLISIPDKLFPSEITHGLDTRFIGKKVYYFDKVTSTMDVAMQWVTKGANEGTIVIAETQIKGRGRLGRQWLSPRYKGIYLSLILKPRVAPAQASIFTLLAAVSICEAVKDEIGLDVQIKWPNDILIRNKKFCGILTEMDAETDEIKFLVIGLGLNVNNDRGELLAGATSLKEERKEKVNRITLLQAILRRIEKNYLLFQKEGPEVITQKWREYNITLGKRVRITYRHKHLEGQSVDIDQDGALLIRNSSGLIQKVTSGDVT
ncbi:MAG: biotin--[acetyl-CoA-carboxylase] ligase [Candidatus Omnitrophota bacterium]|nr:biotin--[acetyl-CoA-carboxylase] ligase [Candidatus Omnitrophota bacterium]